MTEELVTKCNHSHAQRVKNREASLAPVDTKHALNGGIGEAFQMFIPMLITSFDMLAEHKLIGSEPIRFENVGIVTLLLIDFLTNTAGDFDIDGMYEVVRAADKFGVKLEPVEEVNITKKDLEEMRERCEEEGEKKFERKKEASDVCFSISV